MRPARGRIAAAAAAAAMAPRNRTCVVRLEKCDESEDERKKMTGPLKKRPVVMKKSPAVAQPKTRRRAVGEDLSEYMLVTARARRTPKPNPKYSNEDLVTPRNKSKDNAEQSDDEEPDVYQSSEAEIEEEELANESSEEEFQPHRPITRGGLIRAANGELVRRGPGRPPKPKAPSSEIKPMPRGVPLKRRIEFERDGKVFDAILAQNKRLNIELYDASDSDASVVSPAQRIVRGSTLRQAKQQQKPVSRLIIKPEPKKFPGNSRGRPAPAPKAPTSEEDEDDPDDFEAATTGVASTIDDFETMPTFTIVNINDIINKKGDVMIQKTSQQQRLSGGQVSSDSSRNATVDRSVDEDAHSSPNQSSRNRRKSMHTTILSDKIDLEKLKNPPPRTPFPLRKPTTVSMSHHSFNNNNNFSSKSLLNSNQIFKSAPRILNSVLARKNRAAQEQQEQAQLKQQQQQQQQAVSQQQKQQLPQSNHNHQSKENHHFNNFRSALAASAAAQKSAAAAAATPKPAAARKLPAEKVLIQRQGNKIIKKITCFETWHVINIPPMEAVVPKLQFDIPLLQLANEIKEVQLPSADWTYKVTLQKLTPAQLSKLEEHFTGDVQDSNIDPDEKYKYHPVNVMFRRTSRNQKLRMPYDRAVIFKSKTYFMNIDGKNIRLLGAPHIIGSLSELEVLLEVVDEMSLVNPFVEQTTYVL